MRTETENRLPFPKVGMLKIGYKAKSQNGKEYPKSVDYFIPSGKYAGLFTKEYGEKPQTVQVIFLDDDPSKVCIEKYEYRTDKGELVAWGDGQTFLVWDGNKYEQLSVEDYPNLMAGVEKRYPSKAGWKVTLTLNFILPMVRGVMGMWQFVSKGELSTIPNIRNAFDAMKEQCGFVNGIIWDLNVQFAKSQKPDNASKYPVVTLVPNESEENVSKIKDTITFKMLDHGKKDI